MTVLRVFWFFFIIVLILIAWWGLRARSGGGKPGPRTKGYFRREYGEQMEIDLRLPYREIQTDLPILKDRVPRVKTTANEKRFQGSVSSEKNKRMVR